MKRKLTGKYVNIIEKLIDEIETALLQIEDINSRLEGFLSRSKRDFESALLLSRYLELYYNRLETIFLHIKSFYGNEIQSEFWHKNLLYAMTKENSTRRKVISNKTFHSLDELRGFRHFSRYNYRLDSYDWDRLDIIIQMYRKSYPSVRTELQEFADFLKETLDMDS